MSWVIGEDSPEPHVKRIHWLPPGQMTHLALWDGYVPDAMDNARKLRPFQDHWFDISDEAARLFKLDRPMKAFQLPPDVVDFRQGEYYNGGQFGNVNAKVNIGFGRMAHVMGAEVNAPPRKVKLDPYQALGLDIPLGMRTMGGPKDATDPNRNGCQR